MTEKKPRLVIPSDHPNQIAGSPQLERLQDRVDIQLFTDPPVSRDEQIARVRDAELMINSRGHVRWDAAMLTELPNLQFISTCSIGTDAIDLAAARDRGVVVSNIPGRTAPVVAEHALAMMLAVARRVAFTTAELKAGRWDSPDNTFLGNKTIGIVGTGAIGRKVIALCQAIGMNVQAWTFNPSQERAAELGVKFVELDELLATSDVVSLHVKLTEQSRHLLGERELALMKRGSLLVNTARGAVVDTAALIAALESGHLNGAALDVFDEEPLPPDSPILRCQQVVLTPHSADQNPEGRDILNCGAVDNVLAFLDGKPQNVVT